MKTSKNGGLAAPLGNWLHRSTVLNLKKLFLICSINLSFQLMPISSHSPTMHYYKEPDCLLNNLLQKLGAANMSTRNHLFSRMNKPRSLSFSSPGQHSNHSPLDGPPLNSVQFINIYFLLGDPELDAVLQGQPSR